MGGAVVDITRPEPRVTASPGTCAVMWPLEELAVRIEAERLHNHTDGRLSARMRVVALWPDGRQLVLHHEQLNLMAGRSRREVARTLEDRLPLSEPDPSWDYIMETACRLVLERAEAGSPAEVLTPSEGVDIDYLLNPLLLDRLPVVWYAPGGAGKSLLAMYAALLVHNGLSFRGEPTRQRNALYLDFEVTREEAARRCTLFVNGLRHLLVGAELRMPLYRRCVGSILSEADGIARDIARHEVGLVIVDSAGPACGGDIMSAELAIQLFNTLRKVTASTDAAALILTHTTKADRREEHERRLPIGSIYFENLARMTWEIRPQEGSDDRALTLGMFPRKCNMRRPEPLGFRLTFTRDALVVEPAQAHDTLGEQGATRALVLAELERGPVRVADLIEAVGGAGPAVRMMLTRLSREGLVMSPERGVWALTEYDGGKA